MENKLKNKSIFRALYFYQDVIYSGKLTSDLIIDADDYWPLILKDLSNITIEEAEKIQINDGYVSTVKAIEIIPQHGKHGILSSNSVDFLRSKGYALPYMGLSVEKQIEYGWIKLLD